MNHLDEGTIHAWLDGALDAAQARDIQEHVDDCPTCAERVAEARGLIAGASRILTSLDDVPAHVTPKRAPVARRPWRAAPWVTGIAAALILAIGISTWRREPGSDVPGVPDTAMRAAAETPAPAAALAPASPEASVPAPPISVAAGTGSRSGTSKAARAVAGPPAAALDEKSFANIASATASVPAAPAQAQQGLGEMKSVAGMVEEPDVAGCYVVRRSPMQEADASRAPLARRLADRPVASGAAQAQAPQVQEPTSFELRPAAGDSGAVVRPVRPDSAVGLWRRVGRDSAEVWLLDGARARVALRDRVPCPRR